MFKTFSSKFLCFTDQRRKKSKENNANKKRLNRKRRAAETINENKGDKGGGRHRKQLEALSPSPRLLINDKDVSLPLSPIRTFPPQAPLSTSRSDLASTHKFGSMPKDLYKMGATTIRPQSSDPLPRNSGQSGEARGIVMDTRGNFKMHYTHDHRGPAQRTGVMFGNSPTKDAKVLACLQSLLLL